jgi:hypothetical protein
MKKEQWKCIPGYPKYIASNLGNIMRLPELAPNPSAKVSGNTDGRNGLVLSPRPTPPQGHLQVNIENEYGVRKMQYVHRLVALSFIKKRPGKEIIMHKDGNPKNNNVNNLMWGNHYENSKMITFRTIPKTRSKLEETYIKVVTLYSTNRKQYAGKSQDLVTQIANDLNISTAYVFSLIYNKEYKNKYGII